MASDESESDFSASDEEGVNEIVQVVDEEDNEDTDNEDEDDEKMMREFKTMLENLHSMKI